MLARHLARGAIELVSGAIHKYGKQAASVEFTEESVQQVLLIHKIRAVNTINSLSLFGTVPNTAGICITPAPTLPTK